MIETRLLATVFGGFLSALAGIVVAAYQFRRQKLKRQEQWLSKLQALLRLYRDPWPADLDPEDEIDEQQISETTDARRELMYIRADELSERLQSHLIRSPEEIDSDLINKTERLLQTSHEVRRGWENYADAGASKTSNIVIDYSEIIKQIRCIEEKHKQLETQG